MSWNHNLSAYLKKPGRVLMAAIRGFIADDCFIKASALTYYSLLSIVPVFAVGLGIAKGFGFEKVLEGEIIQRLPEQSDISQKLIDFSYNALQNTKGGLITGIGLIVLLWTVLMLLSNIESSFNNIWKVKRDRSFARKFSDYLAITLFAPLFLVLSGSLSVFVVTEVTHMTEVNSTFKTISPFILFLLHISPLMLIWLLFTTLYYIMPNTYVPLPCALIAGILAGTAYQIVQWIYIKFQIGLASYGAVYGSFAALPLFFVWLNTSWLITLAGAEIAHHIDNNRILAYSSKVQHERNANGRVLGLLIMRKSIEAFQAGTLPPSLYHLAQSTGVPMVIIRNHVQQLEAAGLLVDTNWRGGSGGFYQPGRALETITFKAVCDALDNSRHETFPMVYDQEVEAYEQKLLALDEVTANSSLNAPIYTKSAENPSEKGTAHG